MLGQVKVEVKRQLIVITMRRSTVIEVDGNVIETVARSGDSARGTDSTKLDKCAPVGGATRIPSHSRSTSQGEPTN